MKVLITGCTGLVGTIAAKGLSDAGAEVIGFSRNAKDIEGVSKSIIGNVANYDELKAAMTGCDAVLHLAAYHMPYDAPEQDVFHINAGGTFNVFKACAELGIKRLTVASSPNAIGYNFGIKLRDIAYLPLDGAHPLYTTDPYSFTKQMIEEIGRYYYRRYGISSVFMRLGLAFTSTVEEWVVGKGGADLPGLRALVDQLLALSPKEAAQEVRRIENEMDARRSYAMNEAPPFENGTEYVYAAFSDEQRVWSYYVHNFLMFLDSRDLADAIVKSLNANFDGSHDLFIADDKNMLGVESAKLAALLYPGARVHYDQLQGYDALVDYRTAEKVIGFRAKHSVADYYGELYK